MKRKFRSFVSVVLSALMVIAFVTQTFAIPAGATLTLSGAANASFEVLQPIAGQDEVITNDEGNASSSAPTGANPTPTPAPTGANPTPTLSLSINQQLISREVIINRNHVELFTNGSVELQASVYPNSGNLLFIWKSSNTKVAKVDFTYGINDENALITASGEGSCTITVQVIDSSGNYVGSNICYITVRQEANKTEFYIYPSTLKLKPNESSVIRLESLYDYSEATWSSDKTNIANVYYDYITDTATVTAYSDGTATITAKVGTVKATCAVTVSSSGSTEPGTGGNSNVGAAWLWRDVNYEYGIPYTRIAGSEQFKTVRVSFPYGDPFNDVASSLYVGNGYRVILCEDRSYRGRQMWFTSDVPSLIPYNFNDKVSSYIVLKISDEPTLPTLYEDEAFQGSSVSLVKGEYNNLRDYGFNDKMSAIIVPKGYQVTLYEHKNFSGTSHTVIGPTFIPYWNGFNDECSSYKVTTTSAVYGYNEYIGIPSSSQPPSEWSRDGELSVFVEEEYPDEEEHPDVMLD